MRFGALEEDLQIQDWPNIQNFLETSKLAKNARRARCSSYPPPALSQLHGLGDYNDEYRDTLIRISLHLYELVNRTTDTTISMTTFFQDQMNDLLQTPNVYEFPVLINAVLAFCTECNLEKNLDDLRKYLSWLKTQFSNFRRHRTRKNCTQSV